MKRKHSGDLEAEIRSGVTKRFKERGGLIQHLMTYIAVNIMLWVFWLITGQGFPWPLFVTGGWGIGLLSHLVDYYHKHGRGARNREAAIDAEVERQLAKAEARAELGRRHLSADDEVEDATVYDLDNYQARGLRLSDDGELVDLAEAADEERIQKQR